MMMVLSARVVSGSFRRGKEGAPLAARCGRASLGGTCSPSFQMSTVILQLQAINDDL